MNIVDLDPDNESFVGQLAELLVDVLNIRTSSIRRSATLSLE